MLTRQDYTRYEDERGHGPQDEDEVTMEEPAEPTAPLPTGADFGDMLEEARKKEVRRRESRSRSREREAPTGETDQQQEIGELRTQLGSAEPAASAPLTAPASRE